MKQNEITADISQLTTNTGEIVLYQPDSSIRLEVRMEEETVWLTQAQMSTLFQRSVSDISRHIRKIFTEGELAEEGNLHFLQIANSDKPVAFYSLDVIISVGYRVKSIQGTRFRQWANSVLKEYLLRGHAINPCLQSSEQLINQQLEDHSVRIHNLEDKVDFIVRTALPPKEGIFFDGQIFDAYSFVCDLIRSATRQIVLFDNYMDDTVLTMLDKRKEGVNIRLFTRQITPQLQLDINRHDAQYPPITISAFSSVHDRFLCVDDTVYHFGASLKDLGKKWFAFSRMEITTKGLLDKM